MVCSHCNQVALYRASGRGYCKAHYDLAKKQIAKLGSYKQSVNAVEHYFTRDKEPINPSCVSTRLALRGKDMLPRRGSQKVRIEGGSLLRAKLDFHK